MSSKQLNFFLMPRDLETIQFQLCENGIIITNADVSEMSKLSQYNIVENKKEIFQVYLVSDVFKDKMYPKDDGSSEIDILSSYVIEFGLGGFYPYSKNDLQRSRLYSVTGFYRKDGTFVRKDETFILWVDSVFKIIKRFLKKYNGYGNDLLTDEARDWISQNNAKPTMGGLRYTIANVLE